MATPESPHKVAVSAQRASRALALQRLTAASAKLEAVAASLDSLGVEAGHGPKLLTLFDAAGRLEKVAQRLEAHNKVVGLAAQGGQAGDVARMRWHDAGLKVAMQLNQKEMVHLQWHQAAEAARGEAAHEARAEFYSRAQQKLKAKKDALNVSTRARAASLVEAQKESATAAARKRWKDAAVRVAGAQNAAAMRQLEADQAKMALRGEEAQAARAEFWSKAQAKLKAKKERLAAGKLAAEPDSPRKRPSIRDREESGFHTRSPGGYDPERKSSTSL